MAGCSLNDKSAQLAINGGPMVRTDPMPARFALGTAEKQMISTAIDYYQESGSDPGYQGKFEDEYCANFCEKMGGGFADAVATGTASIFVALAALGLPKGSEVLVSPITDPGTLSAIIMCGHVPKLIDTGPDGFNIDEESVMARISKDVGALVCVHSLGRAIAEIEAICRLCHAHGVKVLEDCSQSHFATIDGQLVGTFGDIAAFSTMYRKNHISGASGGIVYTKDQNLYHQALAHADRGKPRWLEGFDDRDPNHFLFPAMNFHTDELSCAIGIASLARIDETKIKRLAYMEGVQEGLAACSNVVSVNGVTEGVSPFVIPVCVDTDAILGTKQAFAEAVRTEGIGLNPHYAYIVRDWSWLRPYLADEFETTNARCARDSHFMLYVNEMYTEREIQDTIEAILKVEAAYEKLTKKPS
tara:strand:+ start:16249 stop:17496 length:1248 start_codon:yes stop_codon:yes gene_type:complete